MTDCFNEYKNYKLVESDFIVGFCESDDKKYALTIKNDVILPLRKEEFEGIKIVYNYPENLKIDDLAEKEVGFVEIYYKNNLIFKEKIYTIL